MAVVAATVKVNASGLPSDWKRLADEANTFTQEDTLAQRIEKLNALMGTKLTLHLDQMPKITRENPVWRKEYEATYMNYPSTNIFDHDQEDGGMGDAGWRVSLRDGKWHTGSMRLKEMFHWTAQIGLGYRIAKAQGL